MSWKQKQEEAKGLIAQAKALNHEGIDSGEKAQTAHRLVGEANRLMTEVREEKLAEEKAKLDGLLKAYDDQATPSGPPADAGPIVPSTITPAAQAEDPNARYKAVARTLYSRKMMESLGIKALNEGAGGAGNFLVPPAYLQDLFAETRRQGNAIRRYGWMSEHPVESNQVLLPRGAGAATVGIVAENATKPSADQAYTQVTINIFTWAGISKVSKQLVMDSQPTAADLVNRELGTLLGNLEEQKILNGSGTGEPRGILNTTGTGAVTAGTNTAQGIIDNIIDGIANIQQNYFAPPTGILMHPRRLAFIQKGKDTANNYLLNPPGSFRAPTNLGTGVTSQSEMSNYSLWGLLGIPVAVSTNIPTNIGGGTNQDAIIVAAWDQAHWFQRQDITMDVSDVAGTAFESNQVWYRLEERAGFSAERYPSAFCVLNGVGLVP